MIDETEICPSCNLCYSFLRCRITEYIDGEKVNHCLRCAVAKEKVINTKPIEDSMKVID